MQESLAAGSWGITGTMRADTYGNVQHHSPREGEGAVEGGDTRQSLASGRKEDCMFCGEQTHKEGFQTGL